ncbi:LysM domain-containing protein [Chaetomium sp. MPI-CAGE-AT-0009]|nr:LysM domain-containing protein [Chaetomium sp. MPI-CAGE-AT-0009]
MEFVSNDDDGGDDGSNPDDKCSPSDKTYSDERPRDGEYMRWFPMDPKHAATTGRTYITIVNLTPHPFILQRTSQYQMDEFDWGTIHPGKSRQNVAHYGGGFPVDTNGEAYYNIGDTGKKFEVRATTHIPDKYPRRIVFDLSGMGKGQREYKVPGQEVPVTLVITGSNDYGFITSLSHGPGNWMNGIKEAIKDRPLRHVVMPGTHDSGMSKLTGAILAGVTSGNTQNQGLTTYDQLRTGARWLDLRVQTVHQVAPSCCGSYEFWTTHINDELGAAPIGQSGEHFDEVVDNINQFTSENPGEVIILQFRYLVGIRKVPSQGPVYWETKQKDEFFDKLRKINNRCGNIPASGDDGFQSRTVGSLMSRNNNKGCVLIFLDTAHLQRNIATPDRVARSDGIYDKGDLSWTNGWPEKESTKDVAEFNVDLWKKPRDNMLLSQWLSSPHILTSTFSYGLEDIAVLPTNPALYWRGVPDMSPTAFPNVIMVDYIGQILINDASWGELGAELYTLAIGLNLYMLSENCEISPRRSPLLPKRSGNARIAPKPQDNPLVSSWNGIIFANGTVVDNPPPTLHVGQPEILRNGTVFSNGTVLTKDIRNPEYKGPIHANLTSIRF